MKTDSTGTTLLDGFDPNANGTINVVVVQPDGKILIGGEFSSVLGVTRNNIARLNTDGTLDTAFNPNANDFVFSIAVQADSKILAGGFFRSIGGQPRNRIARLDATTGLADSFDPNANAPSAVLSIAVQADGKILAGGFFTSTADSREITSPGWMPPPSARFVQPECERSCRINRGAGGRQDFSGRRFHWHRRTAAQQYRPTGCHHGLGRFVRPKRE